MGWHPHHPTRPPCSPPHVRKAGRPEDVQPIDIIDAIVADGGGVAARVLAALAQSRARELTYASSSTLQRNG